MRVVFEKPDRFIVRCTFEERHPVKKAGFKWDAIDRVWFTRDLSVATRLREHFDEPLKRKIDKVSVSKSPWPGCDYPIPADKRFRPCQENGFYFAVERNHSYLAFDMRLGKTPLSVALINETMRIGGYRILIVVPPFLISNWKREISAWGLHNYNITTITKGGEFTPHVNTDILLVPDSLFSNKPFRDSLKKLKFDLCIVDEAHRFLKDTSQRTKFLFGETVAGGLVHQAEKVVLLSGTPMRNGHMDLFPTLKALAWDLIGYRSRHKYGLDFCGAYQEETYGGNYAWNYKASTNAHELKRSLKEFVLVEKNSDLEMNVFEQMVLLDGKKTKKIEKLENYISQNFTLKNLMGGTTEPGTISEYRRELVKIKLPVVSEYIKNILESSDESILVLCIHIDMVEGLVKSLSKWGPETIFGKTAMKERDKITKRFQGGESRVLIANIHTMVGLDLSKASYVVFAESSWTAADNDQARARPLNETQKSLVAVDHLVLVDTLDEHVISTVLKKKDTTNKIFAR